MGSTFSHKYYCKIWKHRPVLCSYYIFWRGPQHFCKRKGNFLRECLQSEQRKYFLQVSPWPISNGAYSNMQASPTVHLVYGSGLGLTTGDSDTVFVGTSFDSKFGSICFNDIICDTCTGSNCTNFKQTFEKKISDVRMQNNTNRKDCSTYYFCFRDHFSINLMNTTLSRKSSTDVVLPEDFRWILAPQFKQR